MEHYTYLLVNLLSVSVPFIFSFYPRLRFYKTWKSFWPACVLGAIIFIAWDMVFTQKGVWGFNPAYLLGIYVGNIPLEECLFFICIPYASVFTYFCFKQLLKRDYLGSSYRIVTLVLATCLLLTGLWNITRSYTGVTFISTALLLLLLWYQRQGWLSRFYVMYTVILLPFSIVNGILTGSWIEEPVVWYNNQQNLGIRLGTIPVEDVFYGMLLLLLNCMIYEYLLARNANK